MLRPATEMITDAIALTGVSRHFGSLRAVDDVSLSVGQGELLGLIGHNGAGKSTLFRMMLGLLPPTHGTLRVAGADVGSRAFRAARRGIGYLPEHLVLYDNLSGLETLRFFARLKGVQADACAPMLDQVGLHKDDGDFKELMSGSHENSFIALKEGQADVACTSSIFPAMAGQDNPMFPFDEGETRSIGVRLRPRD